MTDDEVRIRFDPHVHTDVSHDAVGSVEEVLVGAEEAGLDALAITDHDTVAAIPEAVALANSYDVTVVPGVEVSTAHGHLLALGVEERPPVGNPIDATVAWIHTQGGVAVVPHPFQRSRHGVRKRHMPAAEAIEVFNAWSMTGVQNGRARLYAAREGYPAVAGSDAHEPEMVGMAHTELAIARRVGSLQVADVLAALREGVTTAAGTSASPLRYVKKHTRSLGMKTRSTVRRTFGAD